MTAWGSLGEGGARVRWQLGGWLARDHRPNELYCGQKGVAGLVDYTWVGRNCWPVTTDFVITSYLYALKEIFNSCFFDIATRKQQTRKRTRAYIQRGQRNLMTFVSKYIGFMLNSEGGGRARFFPCHVRASGDNEVLERAFLHSIVPPPFSRFKSYTIKAILYSSYYFKCNRKRQSKESVRSEWGVEGYRRSNELKCRQIQTNFDACIPPPPIYFKPCLWCVSLLNQHKQTQTRVRQQNAKEIRTSVVKKHCTSRAVRKSTHTHAKKKKGCATHQRIRIDGSISIYT